MSFSDLPPAHEMQNYEYVKATCGAQICACTGRCRKFEYRHKFTGEIYKTEARRKEEAAYDKKQEDTLSAAVTRLRLLEDIDGSQ